MSEHLDALKNYDPDEIFRNMSDEQKRDALNVIIEEQRRRDIYNATLDQMETAATAEEFGTNGKARKLVECPAELLNEISYIAEHNCRSVNGEIVFALKQYAKDNAHWVSAPNPPAAPFIPGIGYALNQMAAAAQVDEFVIPPELRIQMEAQEKQRELIRLGQKLETFFNHFDRLTGRTTSDDVRASMFQAVDEGHVELPE